MSNVGSSDTWAPYERAQCGTDRKSEHGAHGNLQHSDPKILKFGALAGRNDAPATPPPTPKTKV